MLASALQLGLRRFNRNLAVDTLLSGGGPAGTGGSLPERSGGAPAGTGASLPDRSPCGRFFFATSALDDLTRLVRDPFDFVLASDRHLAPPCGEFGCASGSAAGAGAAAAAGAAAGAGAASNLGGGAAGNDLRESLASLNVSFLGCVGRTAGRACVLKYL